jgi:hypothetical protein
VAVLLLAQGQLTVQVALVAAVQAELMALVLQ